VFNCFSLTFCQVKHDLAARIGGEFQQSMLSINLHSKASSRGQPGIALGAQSAATLVTQNAQVAPMPLIIPGLIHYAVPIEDIMAANYALITDGASTDGKSAKNSCGDSASTKRSKSPRIAIGADGSTQSSGVPSGVPVFELCRQDVFCRRLLHRARLSNVDETLLKDDR
jgi:hypothetical protein